MAKPKVITPEEKRIARANELLTKATVECVEAYHNVESANTQILESTSLNHSIIQSMGGYAKKIQVYCAIAIVGIVQAAITFLAVHYG